MRNGILTGLTSHLMCLRDLLRPSSSSWSCCSLLAPVAPTLDSFFPNSTPYPRRLVMLTTAGELRSNRWTVSMTKPFATHIVGSVEMRMEGTLAIPPHSWSLYAALNCLWT